MTDKFKIILEYIKDLSVETPDAETLIYVKDNIIKYQMNIDITSKALKNKLIEIYNEGLNVHNSGLLYFQCDKDNNTVDVFFLEPGKIIEMISQESWEQLKINAGDKKIFFVKEKDRIFIVKI